MRTVVIEPDFESWRHAARGLLAAGIPPENVLWSDQDHETPLFASTAPPATAATDIKVPAAFFDIARSAAAHTDPRRWGLLYQLLWRLTRGGEKPLLSLSTDPQVRQVMLWCKAVGRDIHKMHAFVRFRRTDDGTQGERERYVAWFEPQHRIVRLGAPFFVKRFANMDWSILTPSECAHWDGGRLFFTPGVPHDPTGGADALDELWRAYYRSIFNPARLKVRAMQSEMPKKFWKNLPEAQLIPGMIADSRRRTRTMIETEGSPVKPAPAIPYLESLRRKNDAAADTPPQED
jgi:probable DNA metabolism protein